MNVYKTSYDGCIVVCKNGAVSVYEGAALCPKGVQKWLANNEPITIDSTWHDAIAYGMIC